MSQESTERKPWERRPDETDKSWRAFCVYRDMGAERSLRKTADRIYGEGASLGWMDKWSSGYGWVARCAAYDAHLDRIALEEREESIRQAERTLSEALPRLMEVAVEKALGGDSRLLTDLLDRGGLDHIKRIQVSTDEETSQRIAELLGLGGES